MPEKFSSALPIVFDCIAMNLLLNNNAVIAQCAYEVRQRIPTLSELFVTMSNACLSLVICRQAHHDLQRLQRVAKLGQGDESFLGWKEQ